MKYEIGEVVVDKRTGEIGHVFDYGWMNTDATSINMECDAVVVRIDFGLEVWACKNIHSFQDEYSRDTKDILIKK
jgi:hypothetical protein